MEVAYCFFFPLFRASECLLRVMVFYLLLMAQSVHAFPSSCSVIVQWLWTAVFAFYRATSHPRHSEDIYSAFVLFLKYFIIIIIILKLCTCMCVCVCGGGVVHMSILPQRPERVLELCRQVVISCPIQDLRLNLDSARAVCVFNHWTTSLALNCFVLRIVIDCYILEEQTWANIASDTSWAEYYLGTATALVDWEK